MVDLSGCGPHENWVCPNDRQLALRAQLNTGWSVKTQSLKKFGYKPVGLNATEKDIICSVIKRAEELECVEQGRIGRLVERLANMKKNIMGNGNNQCVLCGCRFGVLGSPCFICHDCHKTVCQKCGVEAASFTDSSVLWRCKICAETREMWKKSGAWFFKCLPKYRVPPKKQYATEKYICNKSKGNSFTRNYATTQNADENDDSSSDEDKHSFNKSTDMTSKNQS